MNTRQGTATPGTMPNIARDAAAAVFRRLEEACAIRRARAEARLANPSLAESEREKILAQVARDHELVLRARAELRGVSVEPPLKDEALA